jgi:hypothetical protein
LVFEVVARGERALARAGDDADPEVLVGREVVPRIIELAARRRMQARSSRSDG